ncbi:major facilitator superfamily domain-containing protein [Biscogniauxia marginata]|nr:major facilitator superfamily domain-containing protein [Biscogniauxia marginata]
MGFSGNVQQFLSGTRTHSTSKPPYLLSIRSSTTMILTAMNLAMFTDVFFYALIVPVMPFSLTVQVGLAPDKVQHWTSILLACYSVGLFVCSPFAGFYADHTSSRRWPLLTGLVTLAASTLLLCFGTSLGLLVLGRLLQGFSAAVVWSVGCALLVDTVGSSVGVVMGYANISMCIGLLVAPVIGGAVYAAVGYYAVYYIAFSVIALDIILRLFMIERKVARQWIKEDDSDTVQSDNPGEDIEKAAAVIGQEDEDSKETGNDDSVQAAALNTNAAENGQSELTETRNEASGTATQTTSSRRVIVAILMNPRVLAALYGIIVEAGIMMGFDAILPLFVQRTFDWNSTAAGILFLALFLPGIISPLAGWLADKYGAKWISVLGFSCNVPLLICLRFVSENSIQHKVVLGVLLGLLGATLSCSYTPLMAEISYAIKEKAAEEPGIFGDNGVYGLAYGFFNMAYALGGIIGPIWGGYVVESAGWGTTGWSLALWSATAAVVVALWVGDKAEKSKSPTEDTKDESPENT